MIENPRRIDLHERLPLAGPLSLHVFPSYFCNFKCAYCIHSLGADGMAKLGFERRFMELETYRRAVDSLGDFDFKLKALIFAGHGEPLMHKGIAEMVAYAKRLRVAERVEIVTNGSLLRPTLSDDLIEAGLDRLRVSIQGVSDATYRKTSGVRVDFEALVDNLRYFFEHRRATEIYVKVIDMALEDKADERTFQQIFSPISDRTAIEYTVPFYPDIDYASFNTELAHCKQGHVRSSSICSMPFYMLVLEPDGRVVPCCSSEVPLGLGNVKEGSLKEIWDSDLRRAFLRLQLEDRNQNDVCRRCCVPALGLQEGDYLDEHVERLKEVY